MLLLLLLLLLMMMMMTMTMPTTTTTTKTRHYEDDAVTRITATTMILQRTQPSNLRRHY